jgi:hypothetical protein
MRISRPGLWRGALVGLAGLVGGSAAVTASAGTAGAVAPVRSVVARASAQGVRAVYTIPDYVVVSQIFDGGGPVTQAEADSTGRAMSFSALPYPGENAIAAPGVLSVAFGRSVPLAYPFYVQADYPTAPQAALSDPSGSYSLGATAADGAATAAGSLQGPNHMAGTRSTSSALLDDAGVVRTAAESVSTGISLADGALRIASVTTRSETVLGPGDAKPVTATSLLVEGASVAGHAVTIDADGVCAVGDGGSGLEGAGVPATGPAPSGSGSVEGNGGGSAESAAGTVPVRGASRFAVQPDLGTTGALYSLLGLGGIGLVGATRLLRWRGARR